MADIFEIMSMFCKKNCELDYRWKKLCVINNSDISGLFDICFYIIKI